MGASVRSRRSWWRRGAASRPERMRPNWRRPVYKVRRWGVSSLHRKPATRRRKIGQRARGRPAVAAVAVVGNLPVVLSGLSLAPNDCEERRRRWAGVVRA